MSGDRVKSLPVPSTVIVDTSTKALEPRRSRIVRPGFTGVTTSGREDTGASANKTLQTLSTVETQYAVYPFNPKSDNGLSGVPGDSVAERVEGC